MINHLDKIRSAVAGTALYRDSDAMKAVTALIDAIYEDAKERLVDEKREELNGAAKQLRVLNQALKSGDAKALPTI